MEKKKRPLLLAFCIPVAVMLAAIVYRGIYPFGDRCFLRVDMYNQYMPFFTEFHRKLREGGSLFFSWHAGLGANFLALYAYYLASPVNWLLFFCPEEYIIEFMTVLIVIKIGLCGLTFAWYLKRHFGTDGYEISLFAVFYALSGFISAYNWNIMWLDCIFLAPVVIFGLEELLYRNRPLLYCVSLGASILTNYYISIMLCIFLVLYGIVLILPMSLREKGRSLRDFILYSLLAGGLSGAVLLPGILALRATRFDQAEFPQKMKFYFSILDILARHCMNVATEIRNDHWPNIYCGVAVFLFLPLYICCRSISWREKLPRLVLLVFFYLSFSMNVLEFFWHGLNFPDSLPARQSFLYIFLVLILSFEAFRHYGEFSGRQLIFTGCGALLFLFLCSRAAGSDDFGKSSFVFTMLYLALYSLLLYWYREGSLAKHTAFFLLCCMVTMEAAMNTIETSVPTTSRSRYRADWQANLALLDSLEKQGESGFYRIEEAGRMTKNDGMLAGFPTATLFSSTANEAMCHFYRRLGMSASRVFYSYDGATPLTSALLSVGYMFSDSLEITDDFHQLLEKKNGVYLYRNLYTLPLGFMIDPELEETWNMEEGSPVEVQNRLAQALGIREPLFSPVPAVCKDGEVLIETEDSGYYYIYPEACSTDQITADIDGYEKLYEKVYYPRILEIGWCDKGSSVKLTQSGDRRDAQNKLQVSVYRLDQYTLRRMLHRLGSCPMELAEYSDTYVSGMVDVKEPGLLATSIPAEDGWSVSVDGQQAELRLFGGAMAGVMLSPGRHEVTFAYRPPGLAAGLVMSLGSAAILAACSYFRSVPGKRRKIHRTNSGTVSSME